MQRQPWLSLAPKQQVDTGDQVLELLLGGIAELLVGEQLLISAGSDAFSPSLRFLHQSTHPRASRGDSSAVHRPLLPWRMPGGPPCVKPSPALQPPGSFCGPSSVVKRVTSWSCMGLFTKKRCSQLLCSPSCSVLESVYTGAVLSNWQFWQTSTRVLQRPDGPFSFRPGILPEGALCSTL